MGDYRALYRKWRPVDFDDVSGQNAVTDILKYEVREGKTSHAYLFCGSRGTGKTSCAKILAKAVNCLHPKNGNPCNACEACLAIDKGTATDVLEMDAASNNGVDNVRDLKDEIAFTPAELRYRVYIIDEVHMMSGSAFNALLKTLEEPPAYVIFILATTELSKLPTTIVSRCQRFDFKRIDTETIMKRLFHIAQAEKIALTEDGARMLSRAAQGGMRDAVSLLELCAGTGEAVDEALVSRMVGVGNRGAAYRMLKALADTDFARIYDIVGETVRAGSDISSFWQELMNAYRDMCVVKNTEIAKTYLDLTDAEYDALKQLAPQFSDAKIHFHISLLSAALSDMQRSADAGRSLAEMTLTRMCDPKSDTSAEALALRLENLEKEVSMLRLSGVQPQAPATAPKTAPQTAQTPKTPVNPAPTPVKPTQNPTGMPSAPTAKPTAYAKWSRVIECIGDVKPPLSVQFMGSSATTADNRRFTAYVTAFFADKLKHSEADLSIVRGIISQIEGVAADEIYLSVEPKPTAARGAFTDDFNNF